MLEAKDAKWKYAALQFIERSKALKGGLILKVQPTRTLKVLVKDAKGSPLSGAEVFLGSDWQGFSKLQRTNEKGEAAFDYLFAGDKRYLHTRLDGYYFAPDHLKLPPVGSATWKDTVPVTLDEARRTQKGKVVDKDGKPLAGLSVYTAFGRKTTSDSNGEFALPNLPDVEVPVWAEDTEYMGSAKSSKATEYITITAKKRR